MANLCVSYVHISGPKAQRDAILDEFRAIIPATDPDGRTEYPDDGFWTGLLWERLGKPTDGAGRCASAIQAAVPGKDELLLCVDSKWSPQITPILDFVAAHGPDCKVDVDAVEPMTDLYATTGTNRAFVAFMPDAGYAKERVDALKDWDSLRDRDECLADVRRLLGDKAPADDEAAFEAFAIEYPAEIHTMRTVPLDQIAN